MLRLISAAPVHRHPDRRLARSRWASPYLAIWIALTFAFAALALWLALPPEQIMGVIAEGGPLERTTEYVYFATAVGMWLLRRPGEPLRLWTSLFVTLVAFGAREMDLHKAWTGLSVLKVSFYLGSAPSSQKLVAFGVVLAVILAMAYLLARHGKPAWRALLDRNPIGVTVACFVATLVVSKVLDRAVNVLAEDFQIFSPPGLNALVWAFEEVLELCLPVLAATGLLQHRLVAGQGRASTRFLPQRGPGAQPLRQTRSAAARMSQHRH